jgi:putative ABC transport system permease protein
VILQDLRHGVRMLRRSPGFSAIAIAVLALGIGVNTAVFSLVNTLVLQPRPGRIDELVGVFSRDRNRPERYQDFSYSAYLDLRDSEVFESLMAHTFSVVGITEHDTTKQSFVAVVSSNYFSTLGVPLVRGRAFSPEEERAGTNARVVIASYAGWRRAGFDREYVGRTVRVNGGEFTIVGVAPRGFSGTMTLLSPEWWFPLGSYDIVVNEMFRARDTGLVDRRNHVLNLAGALRSGLTRSAALQRLEAIGQRLGATFPESDRDQTFLLAGLPRMSVSSSPETPSPGAMFSALLMLMAALVLIVACLNLANLLLARGAARRREIAIRQALGGARRRIVQQLLTEGLVLSACGALAGGVVGWWTSGALAAWIGSALPLGLAVVIEPSWRVVPAAALFALFSTLCFALGPAWSVAKGAVTSDLKGELAPSERARRRFGTGSFLVVGQLAVSLALVAAGGLFVRAAINAARINPGFAIDRHLIVSMDPSLTGADPARTRAFYRDVLTRTRSLAGVEHASVASIVPFGEFQEGRSLRLKPGDDPVAADFNVVGADYFATLGMTVLSGREFGQSDEGQSPALKWAVIDRLLAQRLFKNEVPIGRQILVQSREQGESETAVVIGVVSEMRHDAFDVTPRPHVFLSTGAVYRPGLTLHVRTASATAEVTMLGTLLREIRSVDSAVPVLLARTMTEHRYRSMAEWALRAAATVFALFGVLALTLAVIGIYGLLAYEVSRRTREIGIRLALGATARDIERLILGDGSRTIGIAVVLGTVSAIGLGKLASGLLYQVSPFDPAVIAMSIAILSAAAFVAIYLPARRATRVAPLDALRAE